MTITHYYPWARHPRFDGDAKQAFNRFFADGEAATEWSPRVDVREEDNRFVIFADVPGVDPKEIEISMDKGVLTIKGDRKSESQTENAKVTRVERKHGSFKRDFTLPDSVDGEAITAAGKNGVLEISIPKKPQSAPRKIEITH